MSIKSVVNTQIEKYCALRNMTREDFDKRVREVGYYTLGILVGAGTMKYANKKYNRALNSKKSRTYYYALPLKGDKKSNQGVAIGFEVFDKKDKKLLSIFKGLTSKQAKQYAEELMLAAKHADEMN